MLKNTSPSTRVKSIYAHPCRPCRSWRNWSESIRPAAGGSCTGWTCHMRMCLRYLLALSTFLHALLYSNPERAYLQWDLVNTVVSGPRSAPEVNQQPNLECTAHSAVRRPLT